MTKLLKGRLSISAIHNHDQVRLTVQDALSRTQFVEVRMTYEALARALTGQGFLQVEFEFRPALVGLKREHKTEVVKVMGNSYDADNDQQIEAAFAPYEVDGWRGRRQDAKNHHNWRGHSRQGEPNWTLVSVAFERYVQPAEGDQGDDLE